jgi:PadR family transcriptional regulator, regulatory protein AphA
MPRSNKTHFVILGMLASYGEMSGYDVKKILDTTSDWYWSESNAQIYPMLKKLEKDGSVTSRLSNNGARERRLYKITDQGEELLASWLRLPVDYRPNREELLLKVRFGHINDPDVILGHLQQFLRSVKNKSDLLPHKTAGNEELQDNMTQWEKDYIQMTYEYEEELIKAKERWCDKVIGRIVGQNNTNSIETVTE